MQDEADTPTPPDAPGAPLTVPVPSLPSQPPAGEIVGLAASQESPEAPRPARGRPPKGQRPSMTPDAIRRRKRKAKRDAEATPPREKAGPARAPGVPLPGELELAPLPGGVTREEMDQLAGALAVAFGMGCGLAALRFGEHWKLEDDETAKLGNAWAPVLAPYLGGMGAAAPWVTAALVTAGIGAPRVMRSLQAPEPSVTVPPIDPPAATPYSRPDGEIMADGRAPAVVEIVPTGTTAPTGGNVIKPPKKVAS